MTETLTVRPATPVDAAEMAALLNEIIRIGGTTAHQEALSPETLADWHIAGERVIACHVAEAGGRLLGFQVIERHPELPPDIADIATFARAGQTQRGIGRALFAATAAAARAAGLSGINATIRADNTGGLAYYARMGFEDHSIARAVPLADGRPVDRISKRLTLGPA